VIVEPRSPRDHELIKNLRAQGLKEIPESPGIRKAGFQSLQVVSKGSHREPGKVYSINIKAIKPICNSRL